MAQTKISLNLSAASFALSHHFKGPSVIVQGPDQNASFAADWFAGSTPQKGINIPQVSYAENVVPTAEGYRSVAFKYFINEPALGLSFIRVIAAFDGEANSAFIGITQNRLIYIVSAYTGGRWIPITLPAGFNWQEASRVTNTTVRGNSVLCIEGVGIYLVDVKKSELTVAPILGITPTAVGGVCSSSGYMVVWDTTTVYWSSTENPFDFVPSLISGAGSAKVDGLKGKIVLCKEIEKGFIVYADVTIVSAAYSSATAFPWVFAVLSGGAGVRNMEAVGYDINMSSHVVWTSAGLLSVELHRVMPLFPELTDFIASGISDVTTSLTAAPSLEFVEADKEVRVAVVSARYLCISFGFLSFSPPTQFKVPRLTQTFLYDLQLKRWGKLKVDHIQILETPLTAEPPVFF